METSESINELATALVKAKAAMKPALKSAINPAFARGGSPGSKYAKLEDCDEAASPALCDNGLVLMQGVHGDAFVARLVHSSGQWMQIRVPLPGDVHAMTVQQLGSMTTYLRRQTYSLVGLVTDDDDDGNEASKAKKTFGDRSGKPDTSAVDPELKEQYAQGIINALLRGEDDKLLELHNELKTQHELYTAVGESLTAKQRADLRSIVAPLRKKPMADDKVPDADLRGAA